MSQKQATKQTTEATSHSVIHSTSIFEVQSQARRSVQMLGTNSDSNTGPTLAKLGWLRRAPGVPKPTQGKALGTTDVCKCWLARWMPHGMRGGGFPAGEEGQGESSRGWCPASPLGCYTSICAWV